MLTSHGMLKASLTFKFAFMIAACSGSINLKILIPYSKIVVPYILSLRTPHHHL